LAASGYVHAETTGVGRPTEELVDRKNLFEFYYMQSAVIGVTNGGVIFRSIRQARELEGEGKDIKEADD
jgi:hypothetical protein